MPWQAHGNDKDGMVGRRRGGQVACGGKEAQTPYWDGEGLHSSRLQSRALGDNDCRSSNEQAKMFYGPHNPNWGYSHAVFKSMPIATRMNSAGKAKYYSNLDEDHKVAEG